ncbi:MAG: class I SAM-dependent methyltransferase [Cytophagales bacterium]|nr:class I SAM-dependent methyltransferase [Cytophaga sp.]
MKFFQLLYRLFQFIKHYISGGNEHSIHSPFVYGIYTRIIQNHGLPVYEIVDQHYFELIENEHFIENINPGAGTSMVSAKKIRVKQLARDSIKQLPWRQLICRLTHERDPKVIIELGTSFGVTTAYLALTCPDAKVYTFEANPVLAQLARTLFQESGIHNIEIIEGNIDHTLVPFLRSIGKVDVAYIDANHRFRPSIRYAEHLMDHVHEKSLLILDDLYWSYEMTKAWKGLCHKKKVTASIDLWQIGLMYFRKEQVKENFKLRF